MSLIRFTVYIDIENLRRTYSLILYKGSNRINTQINREKKKKKDLQLLNRNKKEILNQHLRMLHSFPLLELIFVVNLDNFHMVEDQYD
jgi:hypothetical protein